MPLSDSILLIDGATGSELDRRGADTSLPLWSARALLEAPEVLADIHREYLLAGAGAITTNTFRTHRRSLAGAGLGDRAGELTRRAVEIARATRDATSPEALILGSVAPLEDCYQPALAPDEAACREEHAAMIGTLVDAGVDLVLLETMNNLVEARAAATAAERLCPGRWMISFCTKDAESPGTLLSGESLAEAMGDFSAAVAVGVNCIGAPRVEEEISWLRERVSAPTRIIAYANVGAPDPNRGWRNTDAIDPQRYASYATSWIDAGATIIGGCCGTTPATIHAIASRLSDRD